MTNSRRKIFIYILVIALVMCAVMLPFATCGVTYASGTAYSDVLEDLQKDASFDELDYPSIQKDYSMKIIQIAESESGELFLYVYQPAAQWKELTATSIAMSTSSENPSFWLYFLRLVSKDGVFQKYVVENFKVRGEFKREYNISAMYRPWDTVLDGDSSSDNTMDEYAYAVRQLWTVTGIGNVVSYAMDYRDVVTIEHQWVGSLRFNDGISWLVPPVQGKTDVHFVGFSTDHKIDKLLEVDITYLSQDRTTGTNPSGSGADYDAPTVVDGTPAQVESVFTTLHADDEDQSNPADGLWGKKHTWQNISTKDEFVAAQQLSAEAVENLKNDDFVVCFAATEWKRMVAGTAIKIRYTKISEVTIMRLMFECNGDTYNLGVVSNKQSPDINNDNTDDNDWDLSNPGKGNDPWSNFWRMVKEWFQNTFGKAWDVIKKVLISIAVIAAAVFIVWMISKIVGIFKRPKVVIKGDKKKKHKE